MNKKGITIVELIFVLSIISVIIGVIVPKLDFSDYYLKMQGRQIVSDLNEIKTISMTEGLGKANRITFYRNKYNIKIGNKPSKDIHLKPNYSIFNNLRDNEIYFNLNGTPDEACTIEIRNINNDKYIKITVTPATGRIHMYDKIKKVGSEN